MRRGLVIAALVGTFATAHADPPRPEPRPISPGRRALAIAAAVGPGFVVRGAGSYLVGEKHAAKTLALGALGGLALAAGTGGLIGYSGANPYTTAAVPLLLVGVGGLTTTWLEDIWIAASGDRVHGEPRDPAAWLVEAGETWQHGAYRERLYQRVGAAVAHGRFAAGSELLVATGGDAWLVLGDVRARVAGDARCAACLVVRTGGRIQRDDDDHVTQVVGELELVGRLGLGRFDPVLRNGFVEGSTGIGANRVTFADGLATDVDSILLGRFAWGAYLPGGELRLYYDHRRDGLAGGIDAWRASGFIGSFGAAVDVQVSGPWAVRGEFQLGNSYLTTLAFSYRGGRS